VFWVGHHHGWLASSPCYNETYGIDQTFMELACAKASRRDQLQLHESPAYFATAGSSLGWFCYI
jgi:hypothetical protein